jgi:hypothetical protein
MYYSREYQNCRMSVLMLVHGHIVAHSKDVADQAH